MRAALIAVMAALARPSSAGSVTEGSSERQFKVHFPDSYQQRCKAVMFAVGTGVRVEGYDSMAAALVQKGFVVVIVDPERGSMTKLDPVKLLPAFEEAKSTLLTWTSACGGIDKWIVGGHSAGGGTAHTVVAKNPAIADAVFSVDPFEIGSNGEGTVNKPALYWGFDFTSCFVSKSKAAVAAFDQTAGGRRVFVRVKKVSQWSLCGYAPKYFHCSIVDGGCTACTNCKDTPSSFFEDVANTVDTFVQDSFRSSWNPRVVDVVTTTPVDMFTNSANVADVVDDESEPTGPGFMEGIGVGALGALVVAGVAMAVVHVVRPRGQARSLQADKNSEVILGTM